MTDPELLASASRVALQTPSARPTNRETNKSVKPKTKLPPRHTKLLSRPRGRPVARSDTSSDDDAEASAPASDERLLPIEEVTARTSLSRSEIYRRIRLNEFPRPIRLGGSTGSRGGRVAFVASEIDAWIAARVAEWREANP